MNVSPMQAATNPKPKLDELETRGGNQGEFSFSNTGGQSGNVSLFISSFIAATIDANPDSYIHLHDFSTIMT